MLPDLEARQAEMRERWKRCHYEFPAISERKVIEKRYAIGRRKVAVRRFGTIPLAEVEELQQLGAFIGENLSVGAKRLMVIMAECALAYTNNDVLREIWPIFANAMKGKSEESA